MQLEYSVEDLEKATGELIDANGHASKDSYLRPIVFRGPEAMGVDGRGAEIHVAMALLEWPNVFPEEARQQGIRLHVSRWRRPTPAIAPIQAKASAFYMTGTLSRHEATAAGFDDALLLDLFGNVAEASGANLFAMIEGALVTPPSEYCLNGIMRQTIIELAADTGVRVIERPITVGELSRAQEIFVTGTAYEILPVRAIGQSAIAVGPATTLLAEAYRSLVRGR